MTQEEISRFALQLGEAERIRALVAEDTACAEGIPSVTELAEELHSVTA
jgi:SpoU rRNA methylase family enzyme